MTHLKVDDQHTPEVLSESIYLHLRPSPRWAGSSILGGFKVVKMAKSLDVEVTPGDYIVKLDVSVAATFFDDSMPSAPVFLDPSQIVAPTVVQTAEADDPDE